MRPFVALAVLRNRCLSTPEERGFVAFFGVRGLGSIYYVGAALGTGILAPGEARTVLWTALATVLVSVLVHGVTANAGIRALAHQEARDGPWSRSPRPPESFGVPALASWQAWTWSCGMSSVS